MKYKDNSRCSIMPTCITQGPDLWIASELSPSHHWLNHLRNIWFGTGRFCAPAPLPYSHPASQSDPFTRSLTPRWVERWPSGWTPEGGKGPWVERTSCHRGFGNGGVRPTLRNQRRMISFFGNFQEFCPQDSESRENTEEKILYDLYLSVIFQVNHSVVKLFQL